MPRASSKTAPRQRESVAVPANTVSLRLYRKIAFTFVLLVSVFAGGVFLLSFSRATITIHPKTESIRTEFLIDVARNSDSAEAIAGRVFETVVSATQEFSVASSSEALPNRAHGAVTITNTTARSQTLVATTRLLSPEGVLFRIEESVRVPAGGNIEVEAAADESGPAGEIGPTRFTIPGLPQSLQDKIYAWSVLPMREGTRALRVLAGEDITRASDELQTALFQQGSALLRERALLEAAPKREVWSETVLERGPNIPIGTEAESFSLTVRLRIVGVFVDANRIAASAAARLRDATPADAKFISEDRESLRIQVERADAAAEEATLRLIQEGKAILAPTSPILAKDRLAGLDKDDARKYLIGFERIRDVDIALTPFWSRKLPRLPRQIVIKIEEE
jgi:hypothetical protein